MLPAIYQIIMAQTRHMLAAGGSADALSDGVPAPAGFVPPAKSLMNLTTAIDSLAFSPDQQVVCRNTFWLILAQC